MCATACSPACATRSGHSRTAPRVVLPPALEAPLSRHYEMLALGFMLPIEHRSYEARALDGRQELSPWIRRHVRLLIDRCCLRRLVCYAIRCGQRSRVSCSSFIRYAHSLREGGCKVFF